MTKMPELKKTHLLNTNDYNLNLSIILINKLCAHNHTSAQVNHCELLILTLPFLHLKLLCIQRALFINITLLIQIFNGLYMTSEKGNNP